MLSVICLALDGISTGRIMIVKKQFMKNLVRPIALTWVAVGFGSLVVMLLESFLDQDIPFLYSSGLTFVAAAFTAFFLFPKKLRVPFGDMSLSEYLRRLGFYRPPNMWKHILLGVCLAACSFFGMLLGSLLTGRYVLDWSKVNLSHTIFSINPGLWEEFFYRGIIMFLLLRATKSLRHAAIIQIVIFGLAHIKALNLWAWVDVLSIMIIAVAFTYTAYKTRTLVAGIVFHFLHDAFLFLPQVPGGEYLGIYENVIFFASLWLMVGVGILVVKFSSERYAIKANRELYVLEDCQ
jgi:membrane protease YdiL (CAAX protease family)